MLTSNDSQPTEVEFSQRTLRDIRADAPTNISPDRVRKDVFAAMFPTAVDDESGDVDLNQVLRECQYNARTILTAIDPDFRDVHGLDLGRAIATAKSYVDASVVVLGLFEIHGWPKLPLAKAELDQK